MNLRLVRDAWCKFWFEPRSPVPLALFRILFSVMVLETLLHFACDFSLYYGAENLLPVDAIANSNWDMRPKLDLLLLLPNTDFWHWSYFCSIAGATVMLLFGLCTRFSAFWLFLGLITLQTHFQSNYNAGDRYEILVALLLALSEAGAAISLDNLIRHRKDDWRVVGFETQPISGWTVRVLQVQLAVAYCHAFFSKIVGRQWLDGSVMYYVSRFRDFHRFTLPFIYDSRLGCKLVAWSTIAIEGAMWTLIWVKELRYWVLFLGILMHLTIAFTMEIPVFEGLFISTYILFVDPKDLARCMDKVKQRVRRRFGRPVRVAFDGSCILCVRSAGLIHRLDVCDRLRLCDFRDERDDSALVGVDRERAQREMLVNVGIEWLGGFRALRWMAWRLPLLWPLAPFMYLPGATILGERVYAWLAVNRFNLVGGTCSGAQCENPNVVDKLSHNTQ
jgi:predicted DCC family thiol-disulfide oxidoreductase YuxK